MVDKKRYPNNPLRNPTQKELRAIFGDLEVVDAKKPLMIFPSEQDFAGATRKNFHDCGFARCAARSIGSTSALVLATSAYFDHVGEDGVKRIHRYRHSTSTRHVVAEFDADHDVDVTKAFVFLPPSESFTMDYQRKKGRQLRKSPRGRTILTEWTIRERLKEATADLEKWKRVAEQHPKPTPNGEAARKQVKQLREKVRVLRDKYDVAHEKANDVRLRPYQPKRTAGTTHNLSIRNGTGFMSSHR